MFVYGLRCLRTAGVFSLLVILLIVFLYSATEERTRILNVADSANFQRRGTAVNKGSVGAGDVHMAVVMCGDRLSEGLVLIKSALIFTRITLHLHIFTDVGPKIEEQFASWPRFLTARLNYTMRDVEYPLTVNSGQWKKLFKKCATQRLFFPSILPDVDALIYVDSDVLFLSPVEDLWSHFSFFNSSQIAAMAPDSLQQTSSYYKGLELPYYGKHGINTGVMLMNLTRMRQSNWVQKIVDYDNKYHSLLRFGDQDIVNIYFHFQPDQVYPMGCDWNFNPFCCMEGCPAISEHGVSLVHGFNHTFHRDLFPLFKATYQAVELFTPEIDHDEQRLFSAIVEKVNQVKKNNCYDLTAFVNKKRPTVDKKKANQ